MGFFKKLTIVLLLTCPLLANSVAIDGIDVEEEVCLALNMYWEVRMLDAEGMLGVSHVVLNRIEDSRYPDTACGVIRHFKQEKLTLNACQFSWYCDGKSDVPYAHESHVWDFALALAGSMLNPDCGDRRCYRDLTYGSTLYHSSRIMFPKTWDRRKVQLKHRDKFHIFYTERGYNHE